MYKHSGKILIIPERISKRISGIVCGGNRGGNSKNVHEKEFLEKSLKSYKTAPTAGVTEKKS